MIIVIGFCGFLILFGSAFLPILLLGKTKGKKAGVIAFVTWLCAMTGGTILMAATKYQDIYPIIEVIKQSIGFAFILSLGVMFVAGFGLAIGGIIDSHGASSMPPISSNGGKHGN